MQRHFTEVLATDPNVLLVPVLPCYGEIKLIKMSLHGVKFIGIIMPKKIQKMLPVFRLTGTFTPDASANSPSNYVKCNSTKSFLALKHRNLKSNCDAVLCNDGNMNTIL